ncbi:hypothetical protein [Shimia biformata]|uniref:hypothetical protein n=1 Tax=Shimia biformata TaxID=1294299 RepID=UPI0019529A23|nr:hypothetical protein [Shimia biformata]
MNRFFLIAAWLFATGAAADGHFEAEDQSPTGKFLNATETRMILDATKGSWVAVREYDGRDLVYLTQLLSWRCALHQIRFSVNGGEMQVWPMAPCYADEPSVNALKEGDQIYVEYDLGSVQSVEIEVLYDDMGTDTVTYDRAAVLMP